MRVLFDATFAERAPLSGVGVYIRRILEALRASGAVEVHEAVNPRRRAPAGGGVGSARNLATDVWWSAVELQQHARRVGADLVHHPLPAYAPAAATAQVITVSDLAFELYPDLFDRGFRTYARTVHRAAARRAAGVVCISESTAADVRRLWGVPAQRVSAAPLGPGQELPTPGPRAGQEHHFLYVGDDEPRKNLRVLLAAYATYREVAADPLALVLAGSATAPGGDDGVRVVSRPDSARLAVLYRDAVALVHPALHEGFGMTPLEAMRLGVPVIAAPSAAVREVCGPAARYAPASSPPTFAAAMAELACDPAERARMSAAGRDRAAAFSWERCARAHVEAYARALAQPSRPDISCA